MWLFICVFCPGTIRFNLGYKNKQGSSGSFSKGSSDPTMSGERDDIMPPGIDRKDSEDEYDREKVTRLSISCVIRSFR